MKSQLGRLSFLVALSISSLAWTVQARTKPQAIVAGALNAFGGEARVRALRGVHFKIQGHWSVIERATRPEAPWAVDYEDTESWFDFARQAFSRMSLFWNSKNGTPVRSSFGVTVADQAAMLSIDGKTEHGYPVYIGDAEERFFFLPDRLLLAALDAPDLHQEPMELLRGNPQYVLSFRWNQRPTRIWIDMRTWRITDAEIVHTLPTDVYWRAHGDLRDRLAFQGWQLQAAGYWYPMQTDVTRNGVPYHSATVTLIERDVVPPERFVIPDRMRAEFRTVPGPADTPAPEEKPLVVLATGIWLAPARWNTLLVAQSNGPVLVDAPLSEVYFNRTFDEAKQRFGAPPSALVLTDVRVPGLAGAREAAARGVPLEVLDSNHGFVESLLSAPHELMPDALARSGHAAVLRDVPARTSLGQGPSRMELIPMRTSIGERVLLVWFPTAHLLWTANALEASTSPSQRAEMVEVIAREHLDVQRVVGSQLPPTAWP